jgi:tRNA(Arg) A34 adenosine deaminase TadA
VTSPEDWLEREVALALRAVQSGAGGPFGAVVVDGERALGSGHNEVLASGDPTAHAEVVAIRAACKARGSHDLTGAVLYSSCEPCPMCLGAIHWARIEHVYYASTRSDAAAIGFDDAFLYEELARPREERTLALVRLPLASAAAAFAAWQAKPDRRLY